MSKTNPPVTFRAVGSRTVLLFIVLLLGVWTFTCPAQLGSDKINGYIISGATVFTTDAGGHTAKPGDLALDLGTAGTTSLTVNDPAFMNLLNGAAASDKLSVSLWGQLYETSDSSAFWFYSPTTGSNQRGFQAHLPWSNNNIYFDTAGCCDGGTQRINADVATFSGWTDPTWWNSWHHFVFVKNGPNKEVWIDGVLFMQGQSTAPLPTDFNLLAVGSGLPAPSATPSLRGLLDDFAVFGSALSSNEIKQIFAGTSPESIVSANPLAFWTFNPPVRPLLMPVQAGPGATGVSPDLALNYRIVNGATSVQLNSLKLYVNGTDVTAAAKVIPAVVPSPFQGATGASLFYTAPTPFPQLSTQTVALVFNDNATPPYVYSNSWPLVIQTYNGYVTDSKQSLLGFLEGSAAFTPDKGGFTGQAGDRAIDLNGVGGGGDIHVGSGNFLNPTQTNTTLSVSLWMKMARISNGAMVFARSPSSNSGEMGFAGRPWLDPNGTYSIYFDTAGCCDEVMNRIYKSITEFPGFVDDSFWTKWRNYVFIYKDTTKEVWIDGYLFLTGSNTSPLPTDFRDLFFGLDPAGAGYQQALIDDIAVYSTALSQASITSLTNKTAPTALAGETVLAYWNCNTLSPGPPFISTSSAPGPNSTNALPNVGANITIINRDTQVQTNTIKVSLNGVDVTAGSLFVPNAAGVAINYLSPVLLPAFSTNRLTVVFSDNATPPNISSNSWTFKVAPYGAYSQDAVRGYLAMFVGPTQFTPDGGGHTGAKGTRAMDLTSAGNGGANIVDPPFLSGLSTAAAKDTMSVSFWVKQTATGNSGFWVNAPGAGGGRDFQAHVPWTDNTIYFDTAGCCSATAQRINANISTFAGYTDSNFWTNWHHFVFQKNGSAKEIYIDGQLFLAGTSTGPLATDINNFYMAYAPGITSVRGFVDDFAVFGGALPVSSITALAAGASPLNLGDTNLIAFWNFEDVSAAFVGSRSPAPNTLGYPAFGPESKVSARLVDGKTPVNQSSVRLTFNGSDVTSQLKVTTPAAGVTALEYAPPMLPSGQTNRVVLTFSDGATPPNTVSNAWSYVTEVYTGTTKDTVGGYTGLLIYNAKFSPDGGGRTGSPGDYAMDSTPAGGAVHSPDASYLYPAGTNNAMTVSFWAKLYDNANNSAFWVRSPSSSGGGRGFQAHLPYGNVIYFDTAGCCDGALYRISANINTFPGYTDIGFWTNWHHYAFVFNAGDKTVWIDGQQFLQGNSSSPLPTDFTQLFIGRSPNDNLNIHGKMDDFAAFGTAVSPDNVLKLYQGTAPSALAGEKLLAFWNFNDPPASATISIGTVNGKLSITYTGKLWSSAVAAGPYTEVTGATSPYPVDTAAATAKFFRSSQ